MRDCWRGLGAGEEGGGRIGLLMGIGTVGRSGSFSGHLTVTRPIFGTSIRVLDDKLNICRCQLTSTVKAQNREADLTSDNLQIFEIVTCHSG